MTGRAAADRHWLRLAIELARHCPRSSTAYAVGAVLVDAAGQRLASGYSRRDRANQHAEEAVLEAVAGLTGRPELAGATLYSSLEPCTSRASGPTPCASLIQAAGVGRVVFAWREPALFADCTGAATLAAAGVVVVEYPELAAAARAVNQHLPLG